MEPCVNITVSQTPKTQILIWADLKHDDMEELEKTDSTQEIERILSRSLVPDASEMKQKVLLEMYTNLVLFCKKQKLSREQTSVVVSVLKRIHQFNTETPLDNMDQCFTYCNDLLLCHSVRRPPFSIRLFSSDQVKDILFYITNTYIRHYFLYKHVFATEVCLELSFTYVGIPEDPDTDQTPESENVDPEDAEKTELDGDVIQSSEVTEKESELPKDPVPKSELRAIVEQEVRNEGLRLTAQLQQRLQESADQLNNAMSKLESTVQVKK